MSVNRQRNIRVVVCLTKEEQELLAKKMEAAGVSNREAFIRKVLMDGQIEIIDLTDIQHMRRAIATAANNINQVAKRANETRSIYEVDLMELKHEVEGIRNEVSGVILTLAERFGI